MKEHEQYNAADKRQVKERETRDRSTRRQELDDIRALLSGRSGRRFFWRLLGMCGVFRSSYSADASLMSFNEGRRDIGLHIQAEILEASTDAYLMMQNESREENG